MAVQWLSKAVLENRKGKPIETVTVVSMYRPVSPYFPFSLLSQRSPKLVVVGCGLCGVSKWNFFGRNTADASRWCQLVRLGPHASLTSTLTVKVWFGRCYCFLEEMSPRVSVTSWCSILMITRSQKRIEGISSNYTNVHLDWRMNQFDCGGHYSPIQIETTTKS